MYAIDVKLLRRCFGNNASPVWAAILVAVIGSGASIVVVLFVCVGVGDGVGVAFGSGGGIGCT